MSIRTLLLLASTLCLFIASGFTAKAVTPSISTPATTVFAGDLLTVNWQLNNIPGNYRAYVLLSGPGGSFGLPDTLKDFKPATSAGSFSLRTPCHTSKGTGFKLRLVYAIPTPEVATSTSFSVVPGQRLLPLTGNRSRKPLDLIKVKTYGSFDSIGVTLKAIIFPGFTYSVGTYYFPTNVIDPYYYQSMIMPYFDMYGGSAVGYDYDYIATIRVFCEGQSGPISNADTFGVVRDPAGDTLRLNTTLCGAISNKTSNVVKTVIQHDGTTSTIAADENVYLRDGYLFALYSDAALSDTVAVVDQKASTIRYADFGAIDWCNSGSLMNNSSCTTCSNTFYLTAQYYIHNFDSSKRYSAKPLQGCSIRRVCGSVIAGEQIAVLEESTGLQVYPNPVSGSANLMLTVDGDRDYQISVYNSIGQVILQKDVTFQMDGQHTVTLNEASDWVAGEYFVIVRNASSSQSAKLLKVDTK